MKNMKILLSILVFFMLIVVSTQTAFCEEAQKTKIKFIYLHGSNCNKQKDFDLFRKQISNLHKYVVKNFNKNEVVKENLLENGTLSIDETPDVFIWGDRSKEEINMLYDLLDVSKLFSPKLAQLTRSILGHCLHDAIWVQQYYNMNPILNDLHKEVMSEQSKGNKVVLLGYSAGTFITLRYILTYSPIVDSKMFLKEFIVNLTDADRLKMDKINPDKTCINAILSMDSIYLKETEKDVLIRVDEKNFIKEYSKMNEITKQACYDDNKFKGVINFGSPLFLFSSSLTNPQTELGQYSISNLANYISKGHFWLSLNFKEDPLGFSDGSDYYYSSVEEFLGKPIESKQGFIYDNSKMSANRPFFMAHYAYLTRYKMFAKNMAKSFAEAYKIFYAQ